MSERMRLTKENALETIRVFRQMWQEAETLQEEINAWDAMIDVFEESEEGK